MSGFASKREVAESVPADMQSACFVFLLSSQEQIGRKRSVPRKDTPLPSGSSRWGDSESDTGREREETSLDHGLIFLSRVCARSVLRWVRGGEVECIAISNNVFASER